MAQHRFRVSSSGAGSRSTRGGSLSYSHSGQRQYACHVVLLRCRPMLIVAQLTSAAGRKEVNTVRPGAGLILRLLPRDDDEQGQTLVEYALLLALIALVVFIAVIVLGDIVADFFFDVGNTMDAM